MMYSAFWFGFELNDFLFKGLNTHSILGLTLLCLSLAGLAVAFEGLKVLHADAKIRSVSLYSHARPQLFSSNDNTNLLADVQRNSKRKWAVCYLVETSLYVVQVVLGYLLMLCVMTYNGFVSLAILLGVVMGYIFFGQRLMEKRIKNTQLTIPCQKCLQNEGNMSTEVTMLDDDGSSSGFGARNYNEGNLQEIT